MFVLFSSALASGLNSSAAAKPCGTFLVGITWIVLFSTSAFACSAAKMMFLLFGNTKICSALIFCAAVAISLALGFIVCPPSIMRSTVKSRKISESPAPVQIASMPISFFSASIFALIWRFCSNMFSIFGLSSSPSSNAYVSALPGLLVCTCTLTSSKSPIQITLSPIVINLSRKRSIAERVVLFFILMMKNSVQ